ncbi:MAG: PAS-domain containing protein [Acetobacterales bacterium]
MPLLQTLGLRTRIRLTSIVVALGIFGLAAIHVGGINRLNAVAHDMSATVMLQSQVHEVEHLLANAHATAVGTVEPRSKGALTEQIDLALSVLDSAIRLPAPQATHHLLANARDSLNAYRALQRSPAGIDGAATEHGGWLLQTAAASDRCEQLGGIPGIDGAGLTGACAELAERMARSSAQFGEAMAALQAVDAAASTIAGNLAIGLDEARAQEVQGIWATTTVATAATLILMLMSAGAVTGRVARVTETMRALASGDTRVAIPFQGRRDEIGDMARALEVFRRNGERLRESEDRAAWAERRLRDAIAAMPGGFALWGADEKLVFCNEDYRTLRARPAPEDMFMPGVDLEESLRRAVREGVIDPDGDLEDWMDAELGRHRNAERNEVKRYPDGRWVVTHRARTSDGDIVVLRTDVTAQRRAEARLQDAIDTINEGFALYDADDRLVLFNNEFRRHAAHGGEFLTLGLTFEEIMNRRVAAGLTPDGTSPEAWVADMVAQHRNVGAPYERRAADGSWLLVSLRRTSEGGTVILRTDITAQKRAEQRLMDAINALTGTFAIYDSNERIVVCNEAFKRRHAAWFGTDHDLVGLSFEQVIRSRVEQGVFEEPLAREGPEAFIAERVAQMRKASAEPVVQKLKDGNWLAVHVRRTANGETVNFTTDVTPLKRAEQRLLDAISNLDAGFALFDAEERMVLFNDTFRRQSLADQNTLRPGMTIEEMFNSVWYRAARSVGYDRESWVGDKLARFRRAAGVYEVQFSNGDWFLVTERRTLEGGTVVIRTDITEQKRAEQQLRDAIESLDEGFALFDSSERLVMCNSRYQEIRDHPIDFVRPGMTYEQILRSGVKSGAFDTGGDPESWIQARLAAQRRPAAQRQRQTPDGRTLMVSSFRTSAGGTVAVRRDVTLQVRAEQRLLDALESINEGFALYDADDRLVLCNKRYKERGFDTSYLQPGVSFETHMRHLAEAGRKPSEESVEDFVARRVREHQATVGTVEMTLPSGETCLITDRRTSEGGIVIIRTDITALKKAEQRLLDAIESIPDGFCLYDSEDRLVQINGRMLALFPRSRDSLQRGRTFEEQVRAIVANGDVLDAIGREEPWIQERKSRHSDPGGAWETRLSNGAWIRATERRTREGGVVGVWTDITELKRREFELRGQEIQLRESESRFRNLVEGSVQGILIDREGKPLFANEAVATMFSYETAEDILTLPSLDVLYAQEDLERIRFYRHERLLGRPAPTAYEFRGRRSDGSKMWGQNHARRITWKGEPAVQSTIVDITERKRNEAEIAARAVQLRESESRYRAVFRNAGVGMARTAVDGRYLEVNETFARLLGYTVDEMLGLTFIDITVPETRERDRSESRRLLAGEVPMLSKEKRYRNKQGQEVWVQLNAVPIRDDKGKVQYVIAVVQDLRERKRQEQELLRAQKMEAIGQLTGGIAHDFNNLLTIIVGNLTLLREDLRLDGELLAEVAETLDDAMSAGRQGTELVKRLLAFARRQPIRAQVIDVARLIEDLLPILQRTLGAMIEVECRCEEDLAPLMIDPAGIETSLLNLAINARDAMPDGGRLTISARAATPEEMDRSPDLEPGSYAVIAVGDTGTGMSPEVLERAFEPFFTSKEASKGSGLGLSMVYGLAKQLGGDVQIDTEAGAGTEVRMILPLSAQATRLPTAEPRNTSAPPGGTESVLVVEDDERVRRLAVTCLRSLGYDVADAADAGEALRELERRDGVDLLFSDVIMPGDMTGIALGEHVRRRWPQTRVLLSTGYAESLEAAAEQATMPPVIYKPYDKTDLAIVVRRALDGEVPDTAID